MILASCVYRFVCFVCVMSGVCCSHPARSRFSAVCIFWSRPESVEMSSEKQSAPYVKSQWICAKTIGSQWIYVKKSSEVSGYVKKSSEVSGESAERRWNAIGDHWNASGRQRTPVVLKFGFIARLRITDLVNFICILVNDVLKSSRLDQLESRSAKCRKLRIINHSHHLYSHPFL